MRSFQELSLIILSLFASLKLMSAFIHETFLNWRQLKIVRRQSTLSYVILINSWKLLSENAQSPIPLKKSTLPEKIQKVQVLLPFGQHYTFFSSTPPPPPPPFCRKGGRTPWTSFSFTCGIVFNYRFRCDILFEENISTLWSFGGMMYIFLSPVFFNGEIPPVGGWEILGNWNLTRSDSDHLNLL